ncbi:uncharacterized protein LOC123549582 [Mercenaria mercenaria]|uniref:uncharacterized protein LOC123549582 n=1 Tax=Mercenaria mercenaria TaxID=6596 RepID=UPI00234E5962|nr:uncharacterized protein LOC123549582 [Mercenaria mercenaria]
MVQKKGKCRIRTGNTIRAINTKYIRRYRKDACIVRRDTTLKSKKHTDVSDDVPDWAYIPDEDVIYSLNKDRRWLLPELLQEAVVREGVQPNDEGETFGPDSFELVERDKIIRNNNCGGIYAYHTNTTKGKTVCNKTIKLFKNGYIDADNILKTPAIHSKNTRRLYFLRDYNELGDFTDEPVTDTDGSPDEGENAHRSEENENNIRQNPAVRYEVFYPCEPTNVLTLKPKRIGNNTKKYFKCQNYIRRPWTLEGYQFRSRLGKEKRDHIYNEIRDGLEDFRSEQDDDVEYSLAYVWLDENNYASEGTERDICELHEKNVSVSQTKTEAPIDSPAEGSAQHVCSETEKETEKEGKIAVDKSILENKNVLPSDTLVRRETEEDLYIYPREITKQPVCVLLRKVELDVHALERHHGDDYLECNCIPRRFVISISKYINDLDLDGIGSAYKLLRIMSKRMFAWLVFVHDPVNKLNSLTEDAYNVSLNANFNENITNVTIEGLVEGSVVTVTDIIGHTLNYLKNLPRESMIFEAKLHASKNVQVVHARSLLEEMKNWSACTYFPDNTYIIQHLIQSTSPSVNLSTLQLEDKKAKNTPCTICYSKTRMTSALLSCTHFFCNRCWEASLHARIDVGSDVIFCPGYRCGGKVDTGLMISFLNVKEILKIARQRQNTDVEKNRLAKWCSNESCGRVVIVNKRGAKITRCSCGESMCFKCSGRPHWPLSCKNYLEYIRILIETHDKNIIPHEFIIKFDGRYCRICFKIALRYDKCFVKHCPCEGDLCLRCSFIWHTRDMTIYHPEDNQNVVSLKSDETEAPGLSTRSKDNIFSEGRRTKWYKLAMKHRIQQHPYRLAKMQANSKLLANRISHYILREEKKGHYVYLEFMPSDSSYLRESERVTQFMARIVDMYKEICSIIENVAFFLNDDNHSNGFNESLHRKAMILSTCTKTIYDLLKDGAFLNPKVVTERLNDTCAEVRRVMESIVIEL